MIPKIPMCRCGKQPIVDQYDLNDYTSPYFVECPCGKTSDEFDCIEDAVDDWLKKSTEELDRLIADINETYCKGTMKIERLGKVKDET